MIILRIALEKYENCFVIVWNFSNNFENILKTSFRSKGLFENFFECIKKIQKFLRLGFRKILRNFLKKIEKIFIFDIQNLTKRW
jgi:hypothetical protein